VLSGPAAPLENTEVGLDEVPPGLDASPRDE